MKDLESLLSTKSHYTPTVGAVRFLFRSGQLHGVGELAFGLADHVVEVLLEETDSLAVEFDSHVPTGCSGWKVN